MAGQSTVIGDKRVNFCKEIFQTPKFSMKLHCVPHLHRLLHSVRVLQQLLGQGHRYGGGSYDLGHNQEIVKVWKKRWKNPLKLLNIGIIYRFSSFVVFKKLVKTVHAFKVKLTFRWEKSNKIDSWAVGSILKDCCWQSTVASWNNCWQLMPH